MDKKLKIVIPVIAGALAVSGVGAAFARNSDQAPALERAAVPYETVSANNTQDQTNSPYHCGYGGMMGYGAGMALMPQVADLLGTTVADLRAQLEDGRTLAEIAAEQGVSQEQLIETIAAPYDEHLDIMVKYGYLTEDEAVTLRQQARERLQAQVTSQYTDRGDRWEYMEEMMDEYGHGGMMGGWGGSSQTPNDYTPQRGFGGMMGGFGGFGGGMMR